jgi:hypothetical protein
MDYYGIKPLFARLIKSLSFPPHSRAPEGAPLKSKMIYASSKDAIKKKFTGK